MAHIHQDEKTETRVDGKKQDKTDKNKTTIIFKRQEMMTLRCVR